MKTVTRRAFAGGMALLPSLRFTADAQTGVSPAEARAIAKEAYIYGFPMVDSYRIQYNYFVDSKGPEFKAPWNQIANTPRVYTPADTAIQTPNSDTPYSWLGLDLRAEPFVLTVPEVEKGRYYSIQFTDAYTFNIDYVGTRSTGNDAGSFLVVGPNWKGETPKGVKKVIRSETHFLMPIYRVQLFDLSDLDKVKKVQAGFKVQPLSSFLGTRPGAEDRFHQAAHRLNTEDLARVLQHPEFRAALLPYGPFRSGADEAFRQDRSRRRSDVRRKQALSRIEDGN